MKEFSNHRLFDSKGRRLAIFGKVNGSMLDVFVLTCSKSDKFSRKLARKLWNNHLEGKDLTIDGTVYKPNIYSLPIVLPHEPKNSFLRHCNDTYCKAYPVYEVVKYHYINDVKADKLIKQYNND